MSSLLYHLYAAQQITLTQIMRGSKNGDGDEENGDENDVGDGAKEGNALNTTSSSLSASSPNDNFLSFWGDTRSTQRFGSMADFNQSLDKFNVARRTTGHWCKATANALQIVEEEEEEGFDALLDLFDSSMANNSPKKSINNDHDDDSYVDNLYPIKTLTPRGKRVKADIERSVKKDHEKKAAIERMCPDWEENVSFANAQDDPEDVEKALSNVRHAKTDLETMKERIMQAFLDRNQTLELYEKTLQGSLDRLKEEGDK